MNKALIHIGFRGVTILFVAVFAILAAYARNFEPGITFGHFTTNGIDLQIDSWAKYNGAVVPSATWAMKNLTPGTDKFFNFPDVKPGDFGCNVISIHVKKGDAWLCLDFKNFQNKDNGVNEPESSADANGNASGELASGLEFFSWIDNGDNVYKPGEKIVFGTSTKAASIVINNTSYSIGDSKNGNSCHANDSRYVGICWCAGTLSVNATTGKMVCDGSTLGNAAQTDSVSVDVQVRAISATGDQKFLCNPVPPPPLPPHHTPKDPKECKNDGWKTCADNRGNSFKNQNDCVNYTNSYGFHH